MNGTHHLVVVPEAVIAESVQKAKDDGKPEEAVNFIEFLRMGQLYRDADMHPIYLLDWREQKFFISTEETFGKRLN